MKRPTRKGGTHLYSTRQPSEPKAGGIPIQDQPGLHGKFSVTELHGEALCHKRREGLVWLGW